MHTLVKFVLAFLLIGIFVAQQRALASAHDDEFAEFDDEEFENVPKRELDRPQEHVTEQVQAIDDEKLEEWKDEVDDDVVDEGDDNGVSIEDEVWDSDEFERQPSEARPSGASSELKITQVPVSLQRKWWNYTTEFVIVTLLLIYITVYLSGRMANQSYAQSWLEYHREILENNFCYIGPASAKMSIEVNEHEQSTKTNSELLCRDYDHVYSMWCSGRVQTDGLLITLELSRRQDLVGCVLKVLKSTPDKITYKLILDAKEGDNFVLAVAKRNMSSSYLKAMCDLTRYAPDRRDGSKFGLQDTFNVFNEIGEASHALLDRDMIKVFKMYENIIEVLHISDQYLKSTIDEEQALQAGNMPDVSKVVMLTIKLPKGSVTESMSEIVPLLHLILSLGDKVSRFKLSRDAYARSEGKRAKIRSAYMKMMHQQRAEAAQQRKEDRKKAEKEKMLNMEDPEQQRRWEEREHRREMKKRGPKIKQVRMKGM